MSLNFHLKVGTHLELDTNFTNLNIWIAIKYEAQTGVIYHISVNQPIQLYESWTSK